MPRTRNVAAIVLLLLFPIGIFQNCINSVPEHDNNVLDLSSYNPTGFKTTLQPLLLTNCSICHDGNTPGAPPFAVSDEVSAIDTLITRQIVDTTSPASSLMVMKISGGHNGLPVALATQLQTAIADWSAGIVSGP